MYAPYTQVHLVSPFTGPRNITALLRFKVDKTDGKYLIANHGAPLEWAKPGKPKQGAPALHLLSGMYLAQYKPPGAVCMPEPAIAAPSRIVCDQ